MSASPEQIHALMTYCVDFAQMMLEQAGEFYPFGATLALDGRVGAAGVFNGDGNPSATEVYELLAQSFVQGAGRGDFLGVALAANVNVPAGYALDVPSAVRVHIESQGYAREIYLPYALSRHGMLKRRRVVEFRDPIAVEVAPSFYGKIAET